MIYTTLFVTLLLAIGLTTAIGIRWMNQRTPSSIVVFHGQASMVDAAIHISGDDGVTRAPVTIRQNEDFTTPIFLEPGSYSFTVKMGGRVIYQESMYVAEGCRYDIDMSRPPVR